MTRFAALLLVCSSLFAAEENPWTKVRELKHGTELRIIRKGSKEPLLVKLDEVTDDRILVISKNSQLSVPKDEVIRLDARPDNKTVRKMTTETKVKTTDPDYSPHPPGGANVPGTSYGSNVSWGATKADFETVYRKTSEPLAK